MEEKTTFGSKIISSEAERVAEINRQTLGDGPEPKIDRNSQTWKAVINYIKNQQEVEFMPMLRKRDSSSDRTQYARGGLDALDGLMEHGGEDI